MLQIRKSILLISANYPQLLGIFLVAHIPVYFLDWLAVKYIWNVDKFILPTSSNYILSNIILIILTLLAYIYSIQCSAYIVYRSWSGKTVSISKALYFGATQLGRAIVSSTPLFVIETTLLVLFGFIEKTILCMGIFVLFLIGIIGVYHLMLLIILSMRTADIVNAYRICWNTFVRNFWRIMTNIILISLIILLISLPITLLLMKLKNSIYLPSGIIIDLLSIWLFVSVTQEYLEIDGAEVKKEKLNDD
jgi:hypothetical protein